MPLWYDCGDGYAKARMARHDMGQPVILCAPGPSMQVVERQPGVMVAALTKAYPLIKPDIWFGLDTPECYDRRVWFESFIKVARMGHHEVKVDGRLVRKQPHTYFADCHAKDIMHIFRDRDHDASFGWWFHTLGIALNILVWMGARTIYLNGFDLRPVGGKDYAPGVNKTLSGSLRDCNNELFSQQVEWIRTFAYYAKRNGISVVSVTPDSPVNAFLPYHSLDMALTMAAKRVPAPGALFHSKEIEALTMHIHGGAPLPFSKTGIKMAAARAKLRLVAKPHRPKNDPAWDKLRRDFAEAMRTPPVQVVGVPIKPGMPMVHFSTGILFDVDPNKPQTAKSAA